MPDVPPKFLHSVLEGLDLIAKERRTWLTAPDARNSDLLARKIIFETEALLVNLRFWIDGEANAEILRRFRLQKESDHSAKLLVSLVSSPAESKA